MGAHAAEIQIVQGDITAMSVDAIVNAANTGLWEGGGVCGAIFAAAGSDELAVSCNGIGGCPTGSAVATEAHALSARGVSHIIHAVGPIWQESNAEECDQLLSSAYRTSLEVAESLDCKSIAFPSISTGIFGFPQQRAAAIAVDVVRSHRGQLARIVLVAYDTESREIIEAAAGVG